MVRFVAIPCHPFPPILPQPEVIVLGAALLIGILMTGAGTWLVHPKSWTILGIGKETDLKKS